MTTYQIARDLPSLAQVEQQHFRFAVSKAFTISTLHAFQGGFGQQSTVIGRVAGILGPSWSLGWIDTLKWLPLKGRKMKPQSSSSTSKKR
jgi:hypothetical protein